MILGSQSLALCCDVLKLDELPQLVNVLLGQMSFVGPRPDVASFADSLTGGDKIILSVRPGITGPATLAFRNEEELLTKSDDPELFNRKVIYPEKIRLNRQYVEEYSFVKDVLYIVATLLPGVFVLGGAFLLVSRVISSFFVKENRQYCFYSRAL